MELGPLLGCSPTRARTVLFETLNLYHRHPSLWAAKLDLLDGKYVNAITQLAGILHSTPEYSRVALDVLRSKALGIMAHPAVALAMLQTALQPAMFSTTDYDHTHPAPNEDGEDDGPAMASGLPVDPETGRVASDPLHCTGHTCGTIENTATIAVDTLRELLDGKQIRVTPVLDLNTIPAEHQNRPSRMLILVRLDVITFLWFALLAVWVVALLRTLVRRRMNTSHPVLHEGGHRPSPSAV